MKKMLIAVVALLGAAAIVVHAQDAKPSHKTLTPEQETVMKEMLAKYDANKDGKLDKTERAAMSKEDKDKMAKAGLIKSKSHHEDSSTNAPAGDK